MFDLSTKQSQLIVAERSFNFTNDDEYLYFINQDDQQFLYRFNLQTGLSEIMVPITSLDLHLIDDYPFIYLHTFDYHTGRSEIYQVNKETLVYQPIETFDAYMIDSLH